VEWVDLTEGVKINVNTVSESQTLGAAKTVVDLVQVTTNGMVAYIGGARLDRDLDYTVNTISRFTLKKPYPEDTRITVAQNETAGLVANPLDANKNLADVENAAAALKNLGAAAAMTGVPMKWPTLDCPSWALVRDGSAYPRASYPGLFAVLAPMRAGTITMDAGGAIVSSLSRTSDLWVGMPYEHATVPAGTTVKSIDSTGQVTLSANATATTANALGRFFLHGYGNGGGATTFGVMDDRGLFDRSLDQNVKGYEKTTLTAVHTAASNVLTGIASTRGMFVGMPVSSNGYTGAGSTITAILSATSVRIAANATVGGTLDTIFTGGQIGNERTDTMQGHYHKNGYASSRGYATGGTNGDFLGVSPDAFTNVGVLGPIADAVNGAPRTGPETRPRFRNYLPIIAY